MYNMQEYAFSAYFNMYRVTIELGFPFTYNIVLLTVYQEAVIFLDVYQIIFCCMGRKFFKLFLFPLSVSVSLNIGLVTIAVCYF